MHERSCIASLNPNEEDLFGGFIKIPTHGTKVCPSANLRVYLFSYDINGHKSLIMKFSHEFRAALKKNNNDQIMVNHFECTIFARIHVLQYALCCKFGHSTKQSKNKTSTCKFCGQNHNSKKKTKIKKTKSFANCINSTNSVFKAQSSGH